MSRGADHERCDAGGADHGAPRTGKVVIGEAFEDEHFGDGIGFGAAHDCRQLQLEHAGIT